MTDIKLLTLLNDFYDEQKAVSCAMIWAMEDFRQGRASESWAYLFEWCENKDRRNELFNKFKNNYPRAMMLKEGYEV